MREQDRARGGSFGRDLHRGGLATRLLSPASLRAAKRRISRRHAGVAQLVSPGGTTHVSAVDGDGNAAAVSTSTCSGSGVIVPGTGIYLNNMSRAGPGRRRTDRPWTAADEHDGADGRGGRRRAAPRGRQCGVGAVAGGDHAGDRTRRRPWPRRRGGDRPPACAPRRTARALRGRLRPCCARARGVARVRRRALASPQPLFGGAPSSCSRTLDSGRGDLGEAEPASSSNEHGYDRPSPPTPAGRRAREPWPESRRGWLLAGSAGEPRATSGVHQASSAIPTRLCTSPSRTAGGSSGGSR